MGREAFYVSLDSSRGEGNPNKEFRASSQMWEFYLDQSRIFSFVSAHNGTCFGFYILMSKVKHNNSSIEHFAMKLIDGHSLYRLCSLFSFTKLSQNGFDFNPVFFFPIYCLSAIIM